MSLMMEGRAIDTGLNEGDRGRVADGLARVLADTYTLYLKTHGYHWNVTGPHFATLHQLFEEHYQDLWTAVDEVAERMRALGAAAPFTYGAFNRLTQVEEDEEDHVPGWQDMVKNLVAGHETAIKTIRGVVKAVNDSDDEATVDLLVGRLRTHEKTAWMLRSMLG